MSKEDHALMRVKNVIQKRLVEEDRPQRAGAVANEHLKILKRGRRVGRIRRS